MKGPPGREGSVGGEDAGIALVGVHSDYPKYAEDRGNMQGKVKKNYFFSFSYYDFNIL